MRANGVLVRQAQKQAAGFAKNVAEKLAAETHRRRVDDGHHLLDVLRQQRVEQGLVGVLQAAQEDVLVQVAGLTAEGGQPALDLHVEGRDVRRQETVQVERIALVVGESRPLVQQRIVEEFVPAQRGFDGVTGNHCSSARVPQPAGRYRRTGGLYSAVAAPLWSGHRDQRFLDLCHRIIADLIELEMREVRHLVGCHDAIDVAAADGVGQR